MSTVARRAYEALKQSADGVTVTELLSRIYRNRPIPPSGEQCARTALGGAKRLAATEAKRIVNDHGRFKVVPIGGEAAATGPSLTPNERALRMIEAGMPPKVIAAATGLAPQVVAGLMGADGKRTASGSTSSLGRGRAPFVSGPALVGLSGAAKAVREARGCRWPIGDPLSESFRFCDAPRVPGKSYCEGCLDLMRRAAGRASG